MDENKKFITLKQATMIKKYVDGSEPAVDSALSTVSTNPVQNKAVSAALAGKLSTNGGTITGNLTLKNSGSYGNKINFGDGDFVHLHEVSDDKLEIKAKNIDFVVAEKITKNGKDFDGGTGISKIEQTTISTADGGDNVITVTLSDGTVSTFTVKNGSQGATGAVGAKGDKGDKGERGIQGEKGEKGDPGSDATVTVDTALSSTSANPLQNKAIYTALSGKLSATGTAASATKLAASRTIQTNLASTSSASFNGTANITPGVTGILPKANGGTGNSTGYVTAGQKSGTTLGRYATVEGSANTASGEYSHAEGQANIASGVCSHAEGSYTKAEGSVSHAEGASTIASGNSAHAEGALTHANGDFSHAGGSYTIAGGECQTVIGECNTENSARGEYFIIGNGSTNTSRSNCFRVNRIAVYGGTYNSSGADYAEYFEWMDGNPDGEDRRGKFVALDGENIRLANPDDDFILGVVSGDPSVIGDSHDDQWNGMYVSDIFGSPVFEDVDVPDKTDVEGNVIIPAHSERRLKLNPDYDNSRAYIPRSERPEWTAVGMMGKLVVTDDGSCAVNGWCKPAYGGVGTKSDTRTNFRVMKRLDANHVRVLVL